MTCSLQGVLIIDGCRAAICMWNFFGGIAARIGEKMGAGMGCLGEGFESTYRKVFSDFVGVLVQGVLDPKCTCLVFRSRGGFTSFFVLMVGFSRTMPILMAMPFVC